MRETKAEKAINKRIDNIYRRECSGISVPILAIPGIFKAGHTAILSGADDAELARVIKEATIKAGATV